MNKISIGIVLLVTMVASVSPAQEPPTFHGSEAYIDFRREDRDLLDERMTDLDGDGLMDSVVVEKSPDGIGLSAWRAEAEGDFKLLFRSEKVPASSVAAFKRLPLGSFSFVFLLDVYEDNPDEADHFVKLFLIRPGTLKQMFSSEYRVTHSEEDAGRDPARVVDLGGYQVGLEVRPDARSAPGGFPELVVRHSTKMLALSGRVSRKERELHPGGGPLPGLPRAGRPRGGDRHFHPSKQPGGMDRREGGRLEARVGMDRRGGRFGDR
jgi:hypothetical protein